MGVAPQRFRDAMIVNANKAFAPWFPPAVKTHGRSNAYKSAKKSAVVMIRFPLRAGKAETAEEVAKDSAVNPRPMDVTATPIA